MKHINVNLSQNGGANANGCDHPLSEGAAVKFSDRIGRGAQFPLRVFSSLDFRHGLGGNGHSSDRRTTPVGEPTLVADPRIPCWKRTLDLTCIAITLPLWSAAMVLVSAWILSASPGPLLYRQDRVGHHGRRFRILKFRTMKVNVETNCHEGYFERLMQTDCPMTKLDGCDSRLIRGGRLLRALALDEVPQILNVLRGEMSLVGPRPCTPHEFERYQPAQKARVNAPPGLTGYWQVSGKNKTTFSEMIAMDLFYAKNMSISLDLKIMLSTIPALALQVFESLTRKAGAKIRPLSKVYFAQSRRKHRAMAGKFDQERVS